MSLRSAPDQVEVNRHIKAQILGIIKKIDPEAHYKMNYSGLLPLIERLCRKLTMTNLDADHFFTKLLHKIIESQSFEDIIGKALSVLILSSPTQVPRDSIVKLLDYFQGINIILYNYSSTKRRYFAVQIQNCLF